MQRDDHAYFLEREANERRRAERAQDLTARRAHLALADRYAEKLRTMVQRVSDPA